MAAQTLIVGLGGSGSDIVKGVYDQIKETNGRSKGKEGRITGDNISFVVFDTDVNELEKITKDYPEIRTIQISTRLTVGEYLNVDEFAKNTWFPVNKILNNKGLTEGAGQIRSISRLALDTAITQGKMKTLDNAIENLYKLNGN